jgi:sugar phosphate isomerase/epimerase
MNTNNMKISTNCEVINENINKKIELIKRAGFNGIEVPVTSKNKINSINLSNYKIFKNKLKDIKIVTAYKICGWFELDGALMDVGDCWKEIKKEIETRIKIIKEIGGREFICVPPYSHRNKFASISDGRERYEEILEISKKYDAEPVLEFMGQTKQINTLKKCIDFLDSIDKNLKYILDTYHVWRAKGSIDDIFLIKDISRIVTIHISDADPHIKRKDHRDKQRPMPGDGFLELKKIVEFFKSKEYQNYYSLGCYLYADDHESDRNLIINEAFFKLKATIQ